MTRERLEVQYLPQIIRNLEDKNNTFKFRFISKISDDLIDVKKELYRMSKSNKKIRIIEKYSDYKEFTDYLKKLI